jgi:hypothetical protein
MRKRRNLFLFPLGPRGAHKKDLKELKTNCSLILPNRQATDNKVLYEGSNHVEVSFHRHEVANSVENLQTWTVAASVLNK